MTLNTSLFVKLKAATSWRFRVNVFVGESENRSSEAIGTFFPRSADGEAQHAEQLQLQMGLGLGRALRTTQAPGGLPAVSTRQAPGAPKWPGRTPVPGPLTPLHAPFPPTGALEIGQALPIHAGRYTCTARNSAGVARKHAVLTVQGKGPRSSGP